MRLSGRTERGHRERNVPDHGPTPRGGDILAAARHPVRASGRRRSCPASIRSNQARATLGWRALQRRQVPARVEDGRGRRSGYAKPSGGRVPDVAEGVLATPSEEASGTRCGRAPRHPDARTGWRAAARMSPPRGVGPLVRNVSLAGGRVRLPERRIEHRAPRRPARELTRLDPLAKAIGTPGSRGALGFASHQPEAEDPSGAASATSSARLPP